MTNRFFVSPEAIQEKQFKITDTGLVHQMSRVLRFKVGERLELLDNTGKVYESEVFEISKDMISGSINNTIDRPDAPKHKINLCMALLKKDNFELVLEKATELGVSAITPILTERCIKKIDAIPERWQKIIQEASEQCGRSQMPEISDPIKFKEALQKYSPGLICFAESKNPLANFDINDDINLFIGPEGDFTLDEIKAAKQNKIEPVNLGSNILRAETAAIAALSVINF